MTNKEPSENTSKIYRQILRGVKKNETDISLTKEESLMWDKIESEIKEARQKNPDVIFDIPWDGDFVAETKEEYSIPKVDIIWIDLQGAELLAFHSMKEHISNVDFIHTEISHTAMYTGQAMFSDIHAFLTPNFTLINNISRTGWQEDGIYMNVKLN
jgi:hypothetical protein